MPPTTKLSGGLGTQYVEEYDDQGNLVKKTPTNQYRAGQGAIYSTGTAGQIVTPDMEAMRRAGVFASKDPRAIEAARKAYLAGQNPIAAGSNALNAGTGVGEVARIAAAGTGWAGGLTGDAVGGGGYGSPAGGGGSALAKGWMDEYLQDVLAQIQRKEAQDIGVSADKLAAEGWTDRSGLHASEEQAIRESGDIARRGARADYARAMVDYDIRAREAAQREADRAAAANAAQYASLSAAVDRLGEREAELGRGAASPSGGSASLSRTPTTATSAATTSTGSSTPSARSLYASSYSAPDAGTLNPYTVPLTGGKGSLANMLLDPARYGYSYTELKKIYDQRVIQG